ncbi:hypothetical protein [Acinetobacter seifertii]|uniref:hypothetical protein n=1 Tax=Acinetobacter seifertii TaxID=1530123 RepID=UPI003EDF9187
MNYLQNVQDSINAFADSNTDLAIEFSVKLGQQLHNAFNSEWTDKEELEQLVFTDNDVLEQTCSEEDADFSWDDARDLQRDLVEAVSSFYNLS